MLLCLELGRLAATSPRVPRLPLAYVSQMGGPKRAYGWVRVIVVKVGEDPIRGSRGGVLHRGPALAMIWRQMKPMLRAIDLALLTPQWKRRALFGVARAELRPVARALALQIALKTAQKLEKPVPSEPRRVRPV